jgi:hypothetical protein
MKRFATRPRIVAGIALLLPLLLFTTPLAAMPFIRLGNCTCMYFGDQGIYIRNCKDMGDTCAVAGPSSVARAATAEPANSSVPEAQLGKSATAADIEKAGIQKMETCVTTADGVRTCVQTYPPKPRRSGAQ